MTKFIKDIKIFITDFDGIFTNGKLRVYSDGTTSKDIDYKDIMAIANLLKKNIKFAIISGENSSAIEILKQKFPNIDIFQNERNKINILKSLLDKYNIKPDNAIYIGDDINDMECLLYVGNAFTVNNAHKSVKKLKNIHVTSNNGGEGAVREVADLIK